MTLETVAEKQELNPQADLANQARKLAVLFALKFGMSDEAFIESLPKFDPRLKISKGRTPLMVIKNKKLSLEETLEIFGITSYIDIKSIKEYDTRRFKTPINPYITWVSEKFNESARDIRNNLKYYERCGTVWDLIALSIVKPELFENGFIAAPGSNAGDPTYRRSYYNVPVIAKEPNDNFTLYRVSSPQICNSIIAGTQILVSPIPALQFSKS